MPAVTFSVQMASGGFNVARNVAAELGYRYYDWQITSEALKRIPTYEPDPSSIASRLMNRLSTATFLEEELPAGMISPQPAVLKHALQTLTVPAYRMAIEDVVRQLAASGQVVIVGHASQVVLQDWPGAFKVLIRGSNALRAARLARELELDLAEGARTIEELDTLRSEFFRRVYQVQPAGCHPLRPHDKHGQRPPGDRDRDGRRGPGQACSGESSGHLLYEAIRAPPTGRPRESGGLSLQTQLSAGL